VPGRHGSSDGPTRAAFRCASRGLAVVVMLVAFGSSALAMDTKKVVHKSPPTNSQKQQDCPAPGDATANKEPTAASVAQPDPVSAKERIPATGSLKLKSDSSENQEGAASPQECAKPEGRSAADAECQGEKSKTEALQCERVRARPADLVLSSSPKDGQQE
jgi:hypothetical protein